MHQLLNIYLLALRFDKISNRPPVINAFAENRIIEKYLQIEKIIAFDILIIPELSFEVFSSFQL